MAAKRKGLKKAPPSVMLKEPAKGSAEPYVLAYMGAGDFRRQRDGGLAMAMQAWDANPECQAVLLSAAVSQMGSSLSYDPKTNQSCLTVTLSGANN